MRQRTLTKDLMRRVALGTAIVVIATTNMATAEVISRCVLVVHQAAFIDGPCSFSANDDGSFTLGVTDTHEGASTYFAYIEVEENDPGKAYGYWNGFPPESHAHEHLGELNRDGACWVSESAKVCAFR